MKKLLIFSAVLALLAASMGAYADQGGIPHNPHPRTGDFTIGIGSDLGSASFVPDSNDWVSDTYEVDGKVYTTYSYALTTPVLYYVPGYEGNEDYLIGEITNLAIDIDQDPAISIVFGCRAGALATTFSFANWLDCAVANAQAQATAAITGTDRNANGGSVTGLWPGGKVYQARYNAGVNFAYLTSGGTIPVNLSYSGNEDTGPAFTPLGVTVTRMEAEYKFTLSARDGGSGTSNYQIIGDVVPEPSGLLVLASGLVPGFALLRRRRR